MMNDKISDEKKLETPESEIRDAVYHVIDRHHVPLHCMSWFNQSTL